MSKKQKAFLYYSFITALCIIFSYRFCRISVQAQGTIYEIEDEGNLGIQYDDFEDYEPRAYGWIDSLNELHTFSTLGTQGCIYDCIALGENEAVVYAVGNANKSSLSFPETIYDSVSEKNRTIVGVISLQEKKDAMKKEKSTPDDYKSSSESRIIGCFDYYDNGDDCTESLKSITFPKTIRFIGHGAFYGFTNLESVTFFSDKELTIERQAFRSCLALKTVDLSNVKGKTRFEARAFANCTSLTSFDFPDGSTVSDYALQGCYNMKRVTNAPGYLSLSSCDYYGYDGFDYNAPLDWKPQLEYVSYGNGPKHASVSLNAIKAVPNGDGSYSMVGNDDLSSLKEIILPQTAESIGNFANSSLTNVILPASVKKINEYAFKGCSHLKSINISNVTYIGAEAFKNCSSLASIGSWPKNLDIFGSEAFYGCKDLHVAVYDPRDNYNKEFDFSGVTSITFSKELMAVMDDSLRGLKDLKEINIDGGITTKKYYMSKDGVLYSRNFYLEEYKTEKTGKWELIKYPAKKSVGINYTIPDFVFELREFAFENCRFSQIHIPVTVSGFNEYWACEDGTPTSNKKIKNGDTIAYFGPFGLMDNKPEIYLVKYSYAYYTFLYGQKAKKETISLWSYGAANGEGTKISAVYPSYKLENGPKIKISYKLNGGTNSKKNPSTMTAGTTIKIYEPTKSGYIFDGWEASYEVNLEKNELTPERSALDEGKFTLTAYWKKIKNGTEATVGSNTYKIGKNDNVSYVNTNSSATSITIPDSVKISGKTYKVTSIEKNAFKGNKKLKKVVIGKNVTSIGANAFSGCKALTKVTIKKGDISTIGAKAFYGCKKLNNFSIAGIKLKKVGSNAFKNTNTKITFKCPKSKLMNYKKLFAKAGASKKATYK